MQGTAPKREYPDWHRLIPGRYMKEEYRDDGSRVYYFNTDWENLLIYAVILHNKDYIADGGMPKWLLAYIETREIVPFEVAGDTVRIAFDKKGWVRNTLVYLTSDAVTEDGFLYNAKSVVEPYPEFHAGRPAPGRVACPQSVWEDYVVSRAERLRYGQDWNPGE